MNSLSPTTETTDMNVCVGVITYRRNDLLHRLLESLLTERASDNFSIIVVDNDANGAAREVVELFESVDYFVEPQPGIVAARNMVLAKLPEGTDAVAFIDDDEMVHPGWFSAITRAARDYDADVVQGPVFSVFPESCPSWISRGGFIQRPLLATGSLLKTAATNNVLIRLSALRELSEPWFDEAYSLTGGSDAELFWRMRQKGASIVWAAEAAVEEDVPVERANFLWVFKRTVRYGNVSGRLLMRKHSRPTVFAIGCARIAIGGAGSLVCLMRGKGLQEKWFGHFAKGLGTIGSCLNRVVNEYRR